MFVSLHGENGEQNVVEIPVSSSEVSRRYAKTKLILDVLQTNV